LTRRNNSDVKLTVVYGFGKEYIYWKIPKWWSCCSLTAVDWKMPGGCCGSIKDGPVQEVNGRLRVDDLEDLTE